MENILFWADISEIPDIMQKPEAAADIPPEQIKRILEYKLPLQRKQCFCARLMEKFLADTYGFSVKDITRGEKGKPSVENINYNVSHSGNLVICAVSDRPVGCDVELVRAVKQNVADKYFSESEKAMPFFKIWTAKESYLKMTGEGIADDLKNIEIVFDENNQKMFIKRNGNMEKCTLEEYSVPGYSEYAVAVCAYGGAFEGRLEKFELFANLQDSFY